MNFLTLNKLRAYPYFGLRMSVTVKKLMEPTLIATNTVIRHLTRVTNHNILNKKINLAKIRCMDGKQQNENT